MRNILFSFRSIGLALATLTTACAPQIDVIGGSSPNPSSPDGNPYAPTAPAPQGGSPSNVVSPGGPGPCHGTELHVVGIYDPYNDATDTTGPATVHITRPGSIRLFLSSYTATNWTVTAGPATKIVSITASGYDAVTVNGPAGVPVDTLDFSQTGEFLGCGYEYPDTDPHSGCESPELIAAVEQHMGQKVNSFHGCYAASDFDIGPNLVSHSNCATNMGYRHTSMVSTSCTSAPPVPPDTVDVCAGKTGNGTYEGFFCSSSLYPSGSPFLMTNNISCTEARANCALNAEANAGSNMQCLWNGQVIFATGSQSGACGQ